VAVDYRFPLCVVDTVKASDVELSVSFTPIAGKIDQAAGLIFRVKDANNYYVARANALENNVNLYHVVRGVRREITGVDESHREIQHGGTSHAELLRLAGHNGD
jgi:hypothetical protein